MRCSSVFSLSHSRRYYSKRPMTTIPVDTRMASRLIFNLNALSCVRLRSHYCYAFIATVNDWLACAGPQFGCCWKRTIGPFTQWRNATLFFLLLENGNATESLAHETKVKIEYVKLWKMRRRLPLWRWYWKLSSSMRRHPSETCTEFIFLHQIFAC